MHVLSLILAAGYIAAAPPATDLLRVFHDEADRAGLGIWVDVLPGGGALAGETPLADAVRAMSTYVHSYAARYGRHASLRGWYINQELNPLRPGQEPDSSWWRGLWRRTVEEGKRARPGAEVMISPFFLLDEDGLRGFEWLAPEVYRTWWSETLGETGIDILAVQDSGAEHLSLSTIDDRRPMLSAFAQAARDHGRAPWVNVESGHHVADTWPAAVAAEFGGTARWESVPAEVFARKLDLAAELGAQVINWGYFPYQNPLAEDGPWLPSADTAAAAAAYQEYVALAKARGPLFRATLWWLPGGWGAVEEGTVRRLVRQQIAAQRKLGVDILWLINTPHYFERLAAAEAGLQ
ncbi:MAG TPA: hypothetical protein DCZ72_03630 [Armatimonadetes bacterium]|nr:hypothetical protein [Armatimonadota bacterium]